jgi:CDP-glucose 4,6-dehydratase
VNVNTIENKRVLVTGATGFLGGWLVSSFLAKGFDVHAAINPNASVRKNDLSQYYLRSLNARCSEVRADLKDGDATRALIANLKPDVVIHLAAVGDVNLAAQNPRLAFETSAATTLNLLEAVRLESPQTLFLSHTTDKVYSGNATPFREDMPLMPSHIYEVAKVTQEHLTRCYATQYGLKTLTVRCGNYFGGYDFNFDRIIPYAIRQILQKKSVELRSSGRFTRDFLYIEDAVAVNHLLMEKAMSGAIAQFGGAYNFSLEVKLSVIELIARIGELMNEKPDIVINDTARSEIPDMQLDCAKSRADLGWEPSFSLDAGLLRTIASYRDHFQG